MKILFVSREYPPETSFGGIATYIGVIAPAMAARGHEVHVLSCVRGQKSRDYQDGGAWVHRRGLVAHVPGMGRVIRMPGSVARLSAGASAAIHAGRLGVRFDVIEVPDFMAEGLFLTRRPAAPVVAYLHTPARLVHVNQTSVGRRDLRFMDRLERAAVDRADAVAAPSRLIVDLLRADGWLTSHEPEVIRYPLDVGAWSDVPSAEQSAPTVLAIGRIEPKKAPDVLIRAAARLLPDVPGLEVLFVGGVGGPPEGPAYLRKMERLSAGLSAPCRFVGKVPRQELRVLLARARVVAVPSHNESFSLAGAEALAAGRPLVGTDGVGVMEILQGSEAGTVVPPDDPDAFAEALRPLLGDPALAARAGAAGRAIVARECDTQVVVDQHETFYRRVVEGTGTRDITDRRQPVLGRAPGRRGAWRRSEDRRAR